MNNSADKIGQIIKFLKDQELIKSQKELAQQIDCSEGNLSRAMRDPSYTGTADRLLKEIMDKYPIDFGEEGEVILLESNLLEVPLTEKASEETLPQRSSTPSVDVRNWLTIVTQKQTWVIVIICLSLNKLLTVGERYLFPKSHIENALDSIGANGVYLNKPLYVSKENQIVTFTGDRKGTNIGGFSTFYNAQKKAIVFLGTYYRQIPALVLYDTTGKKDRETFFLGQTEKEVYFQGFFYRKKDIGGSLMAVDSLGKAYSHTKIAYQKQVIGILSDEVGAIVNNEAKPEERIIAISGIVRARVSAIGGNIALGDLLTSSNIEGVAMKANLSNPNVAGTIIAKALEPYSSTEEGKIRVLIVQQ